MKVFLAWSGKTSKEVASILKSWLPLMNPHIEAVFSSADVTPGRTWFEDLRRNVEECDCALFCLTSDNVHSPWLYYEAGMLHNARVIPLLFDVPAYRLDGPFSRFQAATFEKNSLWGIASDLNGLCGRDAVSEKALREQFEELYPTVEKMLAQVREKQSGRGAEDLKRERDFATVNRKLDAILSRLSQPVSVPRQESGL